MATNITRESCYKLLQEITAIPYQSLERKRLNRLSERFFSTGLSFVDWEIGAVLPAGNRRILDVHSTLSEWQHICTAPLDNVPPTFPIPKLLEASRINELLSQLANPLQSPNSSSCHSSVPACSLSLTRLTFSKRLLPLINGKEILPPDDRLQLHSLPLDAICSLAPTTDKRVVSLTTLWQWESLYTALAPALPCLSKVLLEEIASFLNSSTMYINLSESSYRLYPSPVAFTVSSLATVLAPLRSLIEEEGIHCHVSAYNQYGVVIYGWTRTRCQPRLLYGSTHSQLKSLPVKDNGKSAPKITEWTVNTVNVSSTTIHFRAEHKPMVCGSKLNAWINGVPATSFMINQDYVVEFS